jgi:hypothetical protein
MGWYSASEPKLGMHMLRSVAVSDKMLQDVVLIFCLLSVFCLLDRAFEAAGLKHTSMGADGYKHFFAAY